MLLLVIVSFIILLFLFSTKQIKETLVDYEEINTERYELLDKVLEEKKKLQETKKEEVVDSIMLGGKKIKNIRPKDDYFPPYNYPFYDGAAFYESTPVHSVMTGIPSLYSGGNLKWKVKKFQPFEIANYHPGIARTLTYIPSTAHF